MCIQKNKRICFFALLIGLLIMSTGLFAGCQKIQYLQTTTYQQTGQKIPVFTHFENAEQTNQALEAWFGPAAIAVSKIQQQTGKPYALTYTLEPKGEQAWLLKSGIQLDQTMVLCFPDIEVDAQGNSTFPDVSVGHALADDTFLQDTLWLQQAGASVDISKYGKNADNEQSLALLTSLYEYISKTSIDDSGIDPNLTNQTFRRAVAIGIQNYYDSEMDMQAVYPVNNPLLLHDMTTWIVNVNRDVYGICSQQATVKDALELMNWMSEAYQVGKGEFENLEVQSDPLTEEAAPVNFAQSIAETETTLLTREHLAKWMVQSYESSFGPIDVDERSINFYDTTADFCKKATSADLMFPYPSPATFSPGLEVRMEVLPDWIENFIVAYMAKWYNPDGLVMDALYAPLTYEQMVHSIAGLGRLYEEKEAPALETKEKINDRDYSWYYAQNDTGTYSEINCMPTATAMVLKWRDPAFSGTVESLRNAFPELTGGWTIYPVEQTLQRYGVNFAQRSVSVQNMIQDLDEGKILFCQCNDYDVRESGHCFVVYGYKQRGDSTWFLLHDPAAFGEDAYGNEKNQAKWMEAKYCAWIVDRFSMYYLAIDAS